MTCKFCGCSDSKACAIPMVLGDSPLDEEYPMIALPGQIAEFMWQCRWILPNVCSAPACIDKAYAEACTLVDQLLALQMMEVA